MRPCVFVSVWLSVQRRGAYECGPLSGPLSVHLDFPLDIHRCVLYHKVSADRSRRGQHRLVLKRRNRQAQEHAENATYHPFPIHLSSSSIPFTQPTILQSPWREPLEVRRWGVSRGSLYSGYENHRLLCV